MTSLDSFRCCKTLKAGSKSYAYFSLPTAERNGLKGISRLPFSMKVLLENLLRNEDGRTVTKDDIKAVAEWLKTKSSDREIAFRPARVLMQDFTGVPAVVDLAAMRDAMKSLGGDPKKINPQVPVDLVIDHSVAVTFYGSNTAFKKNVEEEYRQNQERYKFLKWAQRSFDNFRVVPPGTGICHQVNLEYLSRGVWSKKDKVKIDGKETTMEVAYPDTLVGTDSHTTMVNGLSVLGWGVGGIEAEAAMLGQPLSMVLPEVIGFKLTGRMKEGVTATDLVLTVTEMLRKRGVVGKFVEFFGPGLTHLSIADRATLGNMAPEYGATCGFSPIDDDTLVYLKNTGRSAEVVSLVAAYAKAQGMFRVKTTPDPMFTDIAQARPVHGRALARRTEAAARPHRAQGRQDRLCTLHGKGVQQGIRVEEARAGAGQELRSRPWRRGDRRHHLLHQHLQSERDDRCRAARPQGGGQGSFRQALGENLARARLAGGGRISRAFGPAEGSRQARLQSGRLRLHHLHRQFRPAAAGEFQGHQRERSGGRGSALGQPQFRRAREPRRARELSRLAAAGRCLFDRRIHAGRHDEGAARHRTRRARTCSSRISGRRTRRSPAFVAKNVTKKIFATRYADVFKGEANWRKISVKGGMTYDWDKKSTYVQNPPYFVGMKQAPQPIEDIVEARILGLFLNSITTDHISPAGSIKIDSPAGKYLTDHKVKPADFNQYGTRRGNHEVMMRGTFANIRLKNQMVPGVEGGVTVHYPDKQRMTIYDAAMRYKQENVPLVVFAGKEYGTGSSRDWAAKGSVLLGIRAVIAQSFERIHRSNLVGMGVMPLVFEEGTSWQTLGLKGDEQVTIRGLHGELKPRQRLIADIVAGNGTLKRVPLICRIDTLDELDYFKNGGILQYVLRQLAPPDALGAGTGNRRPPALTAK